MDIFKWADEYNWLADYFDQHTGYTYAITKATDKNTIPVYDGIMLIGYVRRKSD